MYALCTIYAQNAHYAHLKNWRWWVKTDFKFEFSTLKLGKNGYFCACLNFFVNQCNENGKWQMKDEIEVSNQEIIRILGKKETYKYLGILEADTIKQVEIKVKK